MPWKPWPQTWAQGKKKTSILQQCLDRCDSSNAREIGSCDSNGGSKNNEIDFFQSKQ